MSVSAQIHLSREAVASKSCRSMMLKFCGTCMPHGRIPLLQVLALSAQCMLNVHGPERPG